jgi:hypothetical protein
MIIVKTQNQLHHIFQNLNYWTSLQEKRAKKGSLQKNNVRLIEVGIAGLKVVDAIKSIFIYIFAATKSKRQNFATNQKKALTPY